MIGRLLAVTALALPMLARVPAARRPPAPPSSIATLPAPAGAPVVQTHVKSVAVFNDGYGFFVREGLARLENGWVSADRVPPAVLGTLWLYTSTPGAAVDTVVSMADNRLEFQTPGELARLLADRIGLRLRVVLQSGAAAEGVLSHVLPDMLLLDKGVLTSAIRFDEVRTVSVLDYPLKLHVSGAPPNGAVGLGMGYLQPGISWTPSYILTLKDAGHAQLVLRGTVVNRADDLDHAQLYFVVGVPNFSLRGQPDYLTLDRAAALAFRQTAPTSAQVLAYAARGAGRAAGPARGLPASEKTDLTFYKKSDVTLARGDVAMIRIFSQPITYSSLFVWNTDFPYVWQTLVLKNDTPSPFPSGPVTTLRDAQPLGQDTLPFTPAGGSQDLRLTVASDVEPHVEEVELQRGSPVSFNRGLQAVDYIPVTLRGTLHVQNFRKTDIQLKIWREVNGTVTDASDAPSITHVPPRSGVNPRSKLDWRVQVPAGGEKTVTYTYQTLVPARVR